VGPFTTNPEVKMNPKPRTVSTVWTIVALMFAILALAIQYQSNHAQGALDKQLRSERVADARPLPPAPRWDGTTTHVTWYGPGFYWGPLACGDHAMVPERYNPRLRGVASNSYPCGTTITLKYQGRIVRTRVVDTGGFSHRFDSTARTQMDLLGCKRYCAPYTINGRVQYVRGWHAGLRPTPLV